jgi:exonuclease III
MVDLTIGFWNIAGARDKFENERVRNWLFNQDIVIISETKTKGTPSVPGFIAINNSKSNHGGVVALVKVGLYPKISMIDVEIDGVIALELSCAPGLRFVGIYNEPTDSLYFRPTTLSAITRHKRSGKYGITVGDLNARLVKCA